ncbi:MAG: EamA family transporter RarD [Pseudomonadota bacterium]
MSQDVRLGFITGFGAYLLWGMMPVYIKSIDHLPADLILVHRILWSLPTGLFFLLIARQWPALKSALKREHLGWLALSAVLIACNWLVYIWAVSVDRVLEASLGYYLNPLLNVVIGAAFLSERLTKGQWSAVGIAAIGVAIMAIALGRVPWAGLFLCCTFAFYSVIRKQVPVDSRAGFVVEAAILFPLAGFWLTQLGLSGISVSGQSSVDTLLLIAGGPVTAVPLILFALSAKRLRLSTIGMMQYIGPTMQFLLGLAYGEAFSWTHAAAFACIWLALVVFTFDGWRTDSRRRSPQPAE